MSLKLSLILSLFTLLLLPSCSNMRGVIIQTRVPSEKKIPSDVRRILVLKNIPTQPVSSSEQESNINYKNSTNKYVDTDSLRIVIPEAFVQFTREENPPFSIYLKEENLRSDSNYNITRYITADRLNFYSKDKYFDLIISINNIIVKSDEVVIPNEYGEQICYISINMSLLASVHSLEKSTKDYDISIKDSIIWKDQGFTMEYLQTSNLTRDLKKEMLKELSMTIAEKLSNAFAPHWKTEQRIYFSTIHSLMRRGCILFNSEKYTEAITEWNEFFDNSNRKKSKSKAAFNIALAYEILGDIDKACTWIEKSDSLMPSSKEENNDKMQIEIYKRRLNDRKKELSLINKLDI